MLISIFQNTIFKWKKKKQQQDLCTGFDSMGEVENLSSLNVHSRMGVKQCCIICLSFLDF